MTTYAITGVTGYIGGKTLDKLSQQKDNLIYAIIRPGSKPTLNRDNIIYVIYDGSDHSIELPIHEADYLIHLAALYTTNEDELSVNDLLLSNIMFSTRLFSVAQRVNPSIVITSASTFSSLNREGFYEPTSLYAGTKKAVEDIAHCYRDLSIHFLTLPDTYGPNDSRPKIHNILANNETWPFTFRSPAEQEIRLLHVDDVIGHLLSSLNTKDKGVHIHDIFAEGDLLTLSQLSKLITNEECLFNSSSNLVDIPLKARLISKPTGYTNKYDFNEIRKASK